MSDELPDFGNREAVEAWLRGQPREVIVGFAVRAALRALPFLASELDLPPDRFGSHFILPVFRATASPWLWNFLTSHGEADALAVDTPALAVDTPALAVDTPALAVDTPALAVDTPALVVDTSALAYDDAHEATRAAADAADAAAAANGALAARAAASAARAAVAAFTYAHAVAFAALAADAAAFADPESRDAAPTAPLWPEGVPDAVSAAWGRLKDHLLAQPDERWEVWTDWYEARLRGETPDWDLERARVLDLDDFWDQGPKAVNTEIARRMGYDDSAQDPSSAATDDELPELPPEVRDASLGTFERDPSSNRLRLVPRPEERLVIDDPSRDADFENRARTMELGCRELAEDIEAASPDIPKSMTPVLRRYASEVAKRPARTINPDYLLHQAGRLRVSGQDQYTRDGLGADFAGALDALVLKHDRFMGDYFPAALERVEKLPSDIADPEADAIEKAEEAADLPRLIAVEVPEAMQADPELQAKLDELRDEVRERGAELVRLDEVRKAEEKRKIARIVRVIGGTSISFAVEVLRGTAVDEGKSVVVTGIRNLLKAIFGV